MAGARSEARGEDKKLKDQFEDQIQKHQKFIEQKINLFQRDPDVSKKYLRPNMETFQAGFFEIASFLRRSLRVIRDIEPQVKRVYEMTMDWLRSMPDNFWSREAAPGVAEDAARSVGILAFVVAALGRIRVRDHSFRNFYPENKYPERCVPSVSSHAGPFQPCHPLLR